MPANASRLSIKLSYYKLRRKPDKVVFAYFWPSGGEIRIK